MNTANTPKINNKPPCENGIIKQEYALNTAVKARLFTA